MNAATPPTSGRARSRRWSLFAPATDEPFKRLDVDNVRAALHWAIVEENDPRFGAALAGAASPFWDALGLHVEGLRWIDRSIEFLAADDTSAPAVEVWLGKSRLCSRLELNREAYAAAERAVLLADRGGEPLLRGSARVLSAYAASSLAEHDAVVRAGSTRPMRSLRRLPCPAVRRECFTLGHSPHFEAGAPTKRAARSNGSSSCSETEGSPRTRTHATIDLAEAEYSLGNRHAATVRAREALAGARALRVPHQMTAALENLAAYLLDGDEIDEAADAAHEACALAFEQRYGVLTNIAIQHCAFVAARRGIAHEAATLAGYVDRAFRGGGVLRGFTEQRAYDGLLAELGRLMDALELAEAFEAGALLSEADAVQLALRVTSSGEP